MALPRQAPNTASLDSKALEAFSSVLLERFRGSSLGTNPRWDMATALKPATVLRSRRQFEHRFRREPRFPHNPCYPWEPFFVLRVLWSRNPTCPPAGRPRPVQQT